VDPVKRLLLLVAIVGCDGDRSADGLWPAFDFIAPDGSELELVRPGEEFQPPMLIRATPGTWELRNGARFDTATAVATWAVNDEAGLRIDGVLVLPEHFKSGDAVEDTVVIDIGERETWYGIFPRTVTVEILTGSLAGEAAFAEGVGPIYLTINGTAWELATYRPNAQ
jgi:hypothetical protein